MDKAQRVIDACEAAWQANKANCSGFVLAVAHELGLEFFIGPVEEKPADDLVGLLRGPGWEQFDNGIAAAAAAEAGKLVLGGLTREELTPMRENGHVVIVVRGPLRSGKYPTAYCGFRVRYGHADALVRLADGAKTFQCANVASCRRLCGALPDSFRRCCRAYSGVL